MLYDLSARIGDNDQIAAILSTPAAGILRIHIEIHKRHGFPGKRVGTPVFLGGHKAAFLAIKQDIVVAIDLLANRKRLHLQFVVVFPSRCLLEFCGEDIVIEPRNRPVAVRALCQDSLAASLGKVNVEQIRETIQRVFSDEAKVILFGSRVQPTAPRLRFFQ